jgi:hypothetical protein
MHHLVGVAGIFLVDGDEHQIVKSTLCRHVVVHNLRRRQLEQRQKDAFGGVPKIEIFHRRAPHDGGDVHRVRAHGHGGHVHSRVQIGFRIEACVIAERPLHHHRFGGIDVAFDHELRVGRHVQVHDRPWRAHRVLAQNPAKRNSSMLRQWRAAETCWPDRCR